MRQTVRFAISAFATAAFAFGALAQTPPPAKRIVPVAGSTAGAHGAQFRTELQLQNPSDAAIGGTVAFRAAAVPGSPADSQLRYDLAPFATLAFEDVVAELGASGLGSLDIISDDERLPIIVVRAYNTRADGGTLGSSIFALAPEDALGSFEPASLIVPADLVRYRLNVGIRTLDTPVALRGSVFAADGTPRGTFTRSFPANFFIQQPADDFTGITLQPNDSIVVELTEGRAFVYATSTDNRTNDPSLQIDRLLRGEVRAEDASIETDEDVALTVALEAFARGNRSYTFAIATAPAHGTLSVITQDGSGAASVVYTPDADFNGSDSFIYEVTDDRGRSDSATVDITVHPVNDAPAADPITATTSEDVSVAITLTGSDADGDALTFSIESGPSSGTVGAITILSATSAEITYMPGNDFNGSDTFTFRVSDGTASATAAVTITVTPGNDGPAATADAWSAPEDNALTVAAPGVLANDSDTEGDPLTAVLETAPASGTLTLNANGSFTYVPAADFNGTVTFTYRAKDGLESSAPATVTITVTSVNDAPAFAAGTNVAVLEDAGPQTIPGWATAMSPGPADEAGQALTFVVVSNSNAALFSAAPAIAANGTLTFTSAPDANGSATIEIRLQDDGGTANGGIETSATQSFTIVVAAVNDVPGFTKGTDVTVGEDAGPQTIAGWATAISAGPADEAAQTLSFVIHSNTNPALFSAAPAVAANGTLTFTSAADANDSATIEIRLQDDGGTASGGADTSATQSFTIVVAAVNDVPGFTKGTDVTVGEDAGPQTIAGWATTISAGPADEAAQALTFVVVSNTNPALFSAAPAVAANGTLTFTSAADANGSATIEIRLQDDGGTANGGDDRSATQSFTIVVTPVDDAPVATDDAYATDEDLQLTVTAPGVTGNDSEVDGDPLTALLVSGPANGTFTFNADGSFSYTPNGNFNGTDSFTYRANDGAADSNLATVTVTVNAINDPPVAGHDAFETFGNTELRVDLAAAPTPHVVIDLAGNSGLLNNDGDPVEGTAVSLAGVVGCADLTAPFDCPTANGGQVIIESDGSFSYRPPQANPANLASTATDSFDYTIIDVEGASATGSVSFTIREVIWYVDAAAAAGGDGRSHLPFNSFASLSGAGGAGDVDNADDYILVHAGTVEGSIELEAGQRLIGEGVGLSLPLGSAGTFQLLAPGIHPLLQNPAGYVVSIGSAIAARVAGVAFAAGADAIEVTIDSAVTATHPLTIDNNVFVHAASDGIGVSLGTGTTGTLSMIIAGNVWDIAGTQGGSSIDIERRGGIANVSVSDNTNLWSSTASAVSIISDVAGGIIVNRFSGNSVHGNTAGDGVEMSMVTFDADPAAAGFQQVSGGTLTIGDDFNPVGGHALSLTADGNLFFDDLDARGTWSGLRVFGSGNMVIGVVPAFPRGSGTSTIRAVDGPALSAGRATLDLHLDDFDSYTYQTGLDLFWVAGAFSVDGDASITAHPGSDAAIVVQGSRISIDYGGSLDVFGAPGVSLSSNFDSTITFTGGMRLLTGTHGAFVAMDGGTVTVTGNNMIATSTGVALHVANTKIGAAGLTFASISADGAPSGIILLGTGTEGGLTVTGTGPAGSGGMIQNTLGSGVSLVGTANATLDSMFISNTGAWGIFGSGIVDATGGVKPSLTIANSRLAGAGDSDGESAMYFQGSSGRILVTDTIVEQYAGWGLDAWNSSGSLTIEVNGTPSGLTGSTTRFVDSDDMWGDGGIRAVAQGTANVTLNVAGVYFDDIEREAIFAQSSGVQAVLDVNLIGNVSFNGASDAGGGFAIVQTAGGSATYDIQGNTIRDLRGEAVVIIPRGPSQGRIGGPNPGDGNVISGTWRGIRIDTGELPGSGNNFTATILVANNGIGTDPSFPGIDSDGILVVNRDGSKTLNVTIENNDIANTNSPAIRYFTDADVSDGALKPDNSVRIVANSFTGIGISDAAYFVAEDTARLCLHMGSNSFVGTNRNIMLNQVGASRLEITQGSVPALAAANDGSTASSGGAITFLGSCTNPPLPTNP